MFSMVANQVEGDRVILGWSVAGWCAYRVRSDRCRSTAIDIGLVRETPAPLHQRLMLFTLMWW